MQSPTQTEKAIMFVRWGQRASDILRSRVTSSTSWGEAVTVWVTASGHSAELGGVMRTSVWIDNHVQPGYGCAIWDERFLIDLSRHCVWCRRLAYGPSAVIVDAALTLYKGNYSATSNNMQLVHWQLMGGLLHLVQGGGDWAGPQTAQACPRCTKCNNRPINDQCTNHSIAVQWSIALLFQCSHWRVKLMSEVKLLHAAAALW